jgi:hypothetical protein
MRDKLRQLDETYLDMIIGILLCGVVFAILGMIITGGEILYLLGVGIGTLAAMGLITNMLVTIRKAMEMNPEDARKYMIKCTLIRYIVMLFVLIPGIKLDFCCFIGIMAGIMSSKFAAFFQRFIHQHITQKLI